MTSENRKRKGLYWDNALYLVEGCRKVDRTCKNCWALAWAKRFGRQEMCITKEGEWSGDVVFREDMISKGGGGKTWAVWNDIGHPGIGYEQREKALTVMWARTTERFLLLTKRIDLMLQVLENREPVNHVWLGTSAGDTVNAPSFHRLKSLLEAENVPCRRFISIDPMLGECNLALWESDMRNKIDVVIAGCESGPLRRRCGTEYLNALISQCDKTEIPIFLKQWDFYGINKVLKPDKFPEQYRKYNQLPF